MTTLTRRPMFAVVVAVIAALGLAACSSGASEQDVDDLRAEVQELREDLATLQESLTAIADTETPPERDDSSERAGPPPTPTRTLAVVSSPAPTPEPTAEVLSAPLTRYIAGTDGVGVSLRSGCHAEERSSGSWGEGTQGSVIERGVGECDGWSVVRAAGATSWVSNQYLAAVKPTPPPTPTAAPTPRGPAPGQISVGRVWFTSNSIGTPEIHVTVRNDSGVAIDAFDLRICPRNAFGEAIEKYGFSDLCFIGVASDFRLGPGASRSSLWTLFGWDTATQATVTPKRSHTVAGTVWTP